MSRNYYLCKGYVSFSRKKYIEPIKLKLADKNLETIDLFTSKFNDIDHLKNELYKSGLVLYDEEIVIGYYKTDEETKKRVLYPIPNRNLVFKNDLELIGIKFDNYSEISKELCKVIRRETEDKNFLLFLISEYKKRYTKENGEIIKVPTMTNGDIQVIYSCLVNEEYAKNNSHLFSQSLLNFINYELFKCTKEKIEVFLPNGIDSDEIVSFKPVSGSFNASGVHNMLLKLIEYKKFYKKEKNNVNTLGEQLSLFDDPIYIEDENELVELYEEIMSQYTPKELVEMKIDDMCRHILESENVLIGDGYKQEYEERLKRNIKRKFF